MNDALRDITVTAVNDSRGRPTLCVRVRTDSAEGVCSVPSGASTGTREAYELRDADGGMVSPMRAIREEILPVLRGVSVSAQGDIDRIMRDLDGTDTKSRLGGNSMIGVSIAVARACAQTQHLSDYEYLRTCADIQPSADTPRLFVNLINGGKHAHKHVATPSPIQEHHVVINHEHPREALALADACEQELYALLMEKNQPYEIGDEGGVVFETHTIEEPFTLLSQAVSRAQGGEHVSLGADSAGTSFFDGTTYRMFDTAYTPESLMAVYKHLYHDLGVSFLEDPFHEDAYDDFSQLRANAPGLSVIGDDLTTTRAQSIRDACEHKSVDAVIIKPNQVGTLSETFDAMRVARENNLHCIVSHRSGETNDVFIADLAYAFGCFGLKAGAPRAPERRAKYQRLIDISETL